MSDDPDSAPGPAEPAADCGRRVRQPRSHPVRSFSDDLIATRGHLVHKLKAKDTTGRWAYYFVLVMPDRETEFLAAIDGDGTVDLEDYGRVIASCYGESPTEEVRDYLLEHYGFHV